jgi:predicted lipid-binding transport protein (Tim44 family)
MKNARLIVAAAAAAGCLIAGCGGSSADDAKSTAQSYIAAWSKGDAKKVCSLMTEQTRAQFVSIVKAYARTTDCVKAVNTLHPVMRAALKGAKVTSVKVASGEAVATVRAGSRSSPTDLRKENGHWKISAGPGTQ